MKFASCLWPKKCPQLSGNLVGVVSVRVLSTIYRLGEKSFGHELPRGFGDRDAPPEIF